MISLKTVDGKKLTLTRINQDFTTTINRFNVDNIITMGNDLIENIRPRSLRTGNSNIFELGYTPEWLKYNELNGTEWHYIERFRLTENFEIICRQRRQNIESFEWQVILAYKYGTSEYKSHMYTGGHSRYPDDKGITDVSSGLTTSSLTIPTLTLVIPQNEEFGKIKNIGLAPSFLETGDYGVGILNVNYSTSNFLANSTDTNVHEFWEEFNKLERWIDDEPITPPIDSQGTFDNSSDIITLPNLESLNLSSALSSDFIRAYYLEKSEVNAFSEFLWSESFTNSILKNQNSPIDNIQKCYLLPFDIVTRDAKSQLKVGNIIFNDSNAEQILAYRIDNQFQEVDFGNMEIKEYYGNFLDYKTDIEIFLPFIGTNKLNIYEVMNSTINLTYRIDILTGNCIALIRVIKDSFGTELNSLLYTFTGNCANELPLNQQINQSMVNRFNTLTDIFLNPLSAISKVPQIAKDLAYSENFGDVMSVKHSSSLNGNNGFMGCYNPYLIITRPINANPKDYIKYNGLPTFYTSQLSEVKGYVEIDSIISTQPDNIPLPLWDDIISKLKDGIIIN